VGKSEAHLKGQIDLRNRPLLNLTIATPGIQATDVEAILKAMAIALPGGASLQGGTASANLAINGPAGALVITGPLNVQDLTIRGFDLGAKVRSVAMLAGIKTGQDTHIQSLDGRLRIAPEGMRFDDIKAVVDGFGSLDGAGTIDAKNDLDFRLTAHLAQGGGLLGGMLQAAKLGQLSTVPFKILGTTADPKFLPDMNSILQPQQNQSQTQTQQTNQLGGMLQQLLNRGKKK
jgi:AsmA protein